MSAEVLAAPEAVPLARVIGIPQCCLLLLIGSSGCGKSAFAAAHFRPSEVLSSDAFRAIVSDDEEAMDASADAFRLMREVAAVRLRRGLLTVIDATNLRPDDRKAFIDVATQGYAVAVAIVFDVPEQVCAERNRIRAETSPRRTPRRVISRHMRDVRGALRSARQEGFAHVHEVGADARDTVRVERERLWTDRRDEHGPFDIIGDVHGCVDELLVLVGQLGYEVEPDRRDDMVRHRVSHPEGRRLIGLGDFCDRGPDSPGVLSFWMDAVASGAALVVRGNHDMMLQRHLRGMKVPLVHGFDRTAEQFALAPQALRTEAKKFVEAMTSHLLLDGGKLAVAHAGVREEMQGRAGKLVRQFCTYGETTGETDEYGLRVRHDWARDYRGKAAVVYGHVPTLEAEWVNNTICVDTGCVFGGALTALRWPEREIVSVPAAQVHCEPVRPLALPVAKVAPSSGGNLPEVALLTSKLAITTRYSERPITVQQGQMQAAFETLARHTVDPRWLVTLPPTTATVEASAMAGWLERPEEAFQHYARAGARSVVAQFNVWPAPPASVFRDPVWSVYANVSGLGAMPRPRWRSARSGPHKHIGVERH